MTIEGLQNYLGARMPLQLNASQYLRLFATVFGVVFASAAVIHFLIPERQELAGTLRHAAAVALIYTAGVGLATLLLHMLRDTTRGVRVWHLWSASFLGFVLGYFFLPFDALPGWPFAVDTGYHVRPMRFHQLLPVWCLATYLFVQPYLTAGLQAEIGRLRKVNELLENRALPGESSGRATVRFESGRTEFTLSPDSIRNIAVDDHYCYIHFKFRGSLEKRDLAMPLRDVHRLLPEGFVRVHRAHIVNLQHVVAVRRRNRSLRLILDSGYEVPVSRHRLDDVLPLIRQQLGPASRGQ